MRCFFFVYRIGFDVSLLYTQTNVAKLVQVKINLSTES